MKSIPYASARAGDRAREEIERILRRFGCTSVGWAADWEAHTITLSFFYRGRHVQMRVSAAGWAKMYLDAHPWNPRRTQSKAEYEQRWLVQGEIACASILRDWLKGQIVAVESGLLEFDHIFLPHMLCSDGRTVAERIHSLPLLAESHYH